MEWFYRDMRRKTGLLMEGDKPAGGKWNYDHDNRKPAPGQITFDGPLHFQIDAVVAEVLDLVEARFAGNFGTLRPFWFATDRTGALGRARPFHHPCPAALWRFSGCDAGRQPLPLPFRHLDVSQRWPSGLAGGLRGRRAGLHGRASAPLNAVEGFIRQIIGWREYMRGVYFHEGPDYTARNWLDHDRALPDFYWTADTDMRCMSRAVEQTRDEAYAHHIQRLMVTGNFALLAGIDPHQVHEWYLAVYADAYEWVEAPNVIGMSQFADGGIVGSKPYVSGGNYINKMSDYCKHCRYEIGEKSGDKACPFNYLYWAFLHRHRDRFGRNPRMAQMYRTWMTMSDDKRQAALESADAFLARLDRGARV
jgi:deoxyribodipyrimidine photolyase-related protein